MREASDRAVLVVVVVVVVVVAVVVALDRSRGAIGVSRDEKAQRQHSMWTCGRARRGGM